MRNTWKYIFIIIVVALGFSVIRKSMLKPSYSKTSDVQIQSTGYEEGLNIIKSATRIRHGENGYITVQGHPNKEYIIKSYYKKGNKIFNVSKASTTDVNGVASFIWTVDKETVPGTYPITIKGEGKTINLKHTVVSKKY